MGSGSFENLNFPPDAKPEEVLQSLPSLLNNPLTSLEGSVKLLDKWNTDEAFQQLPLTTIADYFRSSAISLRVIHQQLELYLSGQDGKKST